MLFFLILSNCNLLAQNQFITHDFIQEPLKIYQYRVKKEQERTKITTIKKHEVIISFKEGFKDSLVVLVEDSLYLKAFVQSDIYGRGWSDTSFKINFRSFKKQHLTITFVLPEHKRYVTFKLNTSHRLLKVHHVESLWEITKTDYIPEYQ
ncbi:hypothetical protein [Xanthocytophaga flava]|uniref:hypothetical protein n=1 Tax=Xanthocytophaga flava TaxID=3048013 RepID=UPI0028D01222|nr:hypothetical protein [Xanthocytophaga flavus]MDJ1471008.1 hypothetical protein [Xanthocytophaga flavus]